jgi:hypothetical protein
MDLTFREKSVLGSLIFTTVLFTYYFFEVFQVVTVGSSEALLDLPFLVVGVLIVLVIVETVYHAVVAVHGKPEELDERDKLIEARATKISYRVLLGGSFLAVGHLMLSNFVEHVGRQEILTTPIMTANLVLFSVILAEICGFALQLYYYRRGFQR